MREVVEPSPRARASRSALCSVAAVAANTSISPMQRQLAIKAEQVAEILRRFGGISNPPVEPIVPSPLHFHYRNRITVHSKSGRVGFFGSRSRRHRRSLGMPDRDRARQCPACGAACSRPKDGDYPLREPSEFRGFRQVNDAVADRLLDIVEEMARPGGRLLVDAYCGAGFFAKRLAALFELTIGIEWSVDAIRVARQGAGAREIYLLGDVKHHLVAALDGRPCDTYHPSGRPARKKALRGKSSTQFASRLPSRLIYVSCNPATLARDIKQLGRLYALRRVCPIDMFPQTAEIEVAAFLEKT